MKKPDAPNERVEAQNKLLALREPVTKSTRIFLACEFVTKHNLLKMI